MSDKDRRGAPSYDLSEWNEALAAVNRLANTRASLGADREAPPIVPYDDAQLDRAIAEIRTAARRLDKPAAPEPDRHARKRRIAWLVFAAVWIVMALMTAASVGAVYLFILQAAAG
jgi:hypothetical protein